MEPSVLGRVEQASSGRSVPGTMTGRIETEFGVRTRIVLRHRTWLRCVRSSFGDRDGGRSTSTTSMPMNGCVLPPTKTQAAVPDETLADVDVRALRDHQDLA